MTPLITLALLLTATPPEKPPTEKQQADKQLTVAAMHAAMHAVTSLQPYLASPDAFRDPANAAIVSSQLDALAGLKHRFTRPGKQDAAVETLAGLFGEHVARTSVEFKKGSTEFARARLRSITSLCFACHSRQGAPKDFEDATKSVDALSLPPLRKAEFFATTRQFDKAIALWTQTFEAPAKGEIDWFEQAAAMRQYLSITVRVKDDREATVKLLNRQLPRKDLPVFFRRIVERWYADALTWKKDPFVAATATPAELFAKAKALVDESGAAKSVISEEGRFISTLRASAYLHTALEKEPHAIWRGDALYLLGVATAATLDPLLWDLDDLYLEACIREKPHSPVARQCADRMYDRAWFGWSGSGGTRIPPDVASRLGELRLLAQ